jgi:hypothetical protein
VQFFACHFAIENSTGHPLLDHPACCNDLFIVLMAISEGKCPLEEVI